MVEWIKRLYSVAVHSGLIPSRVNQSFENWYLQLPCWTLNIKGQGGEQAGKFICCAVGKGT